MKYPAALIIAHSGGMQQAWFRSVDEAKATLDQFATRLATIKEYNNRDDDPIFRYEAAGAFYVVDLRKCLSASVEITEEWSDVRLEGSINHLIDRRAMKARAETGGLTAELEQLERREKTAA